jgi:hypothetical protein
LEGAATGLALGATPALLFWALNEADAGVDAPFVGRTGSGTGVLSVASRSWKRAASGANVLASTSLSSVKWRTSSLGSAVIASVKWVMAGKISIGCSCAGAPAKELPRLSDEVRGGFVRVCRTGCARRLRLTEPSGAGGFAVFISELCRRCAPRWGEGMRGRFEKLVEELVAGRLDWSRGAESGSTEKQARRGRGRYKPKVSTSNDSRV